MLPLLDNLKDPLVASSFLNTYAHLLVLNARYEEALSVSQAELQVARQYRLDFVFPHALLVSAAALIGIREFTQAAEQIEAAENHCRQSRDVHIAMYAATLRTRVAIQKHEFTDALARTAVRWNRPGSQPARADLLAYRALAAACQGDTSMSHASCADAHELAGLCIEATTLMACAGGITALDEGRPDAANVALEAFRFVEATGAFDSFVTSARASSHFLTAVLESLGDETAVGRVLTDSNDFKLARAAGLILEGPRRGPQKDLTERELEVARLVARGYTNHMIAEALYISDSTVKVHVRHILEKLGARSRAELAGRIASVD
jgi:ATP/maltotriose-dependent transcriptional regulator MalT